MANNTIVASKIQNPKSKIGSVLTSHPDLTVALILFCGAAFFLPNLNSYFLADDFVLLSWTHISFPGDVFGFFDPSTTWFYRPIVKLFYWVGQSVFGLHAAPFHIFSILLHWANAYLVYRLTLRFWILDFGFWTPFESEESIQNPKSKIQNQMVGLAAGLLFLLYPAHAEAVSWIAAVGDLIAVSCILGALFYFDNYCEHAEGKYLVASLLLFVLGLLTRETTVMLPALLLLFALIFGRWRLLSLRQVALAGATYIAMLTGYLALQLGGKAALPATQVSQTPQLRLLNLDSILLGILDYVHRLVPGGDLLARQPLDVLRVLVWLEWLLLTALAVWLWRKGKRLMLFGLGWTLLTPFLFVFFSPPTDRYMYLVSIGYAIFAAGLFDFGFWILDFGSTRKQSKIQNPKSKIQASVVILLLPTLILSQAIQLVGKESLWQTAGKSTGGVFNDMKQAAPEPRDYTAFYFVGLPDTLNGVPTFLNAFPIAVQRIYDNKTVAASAVTCQYLQTAELPRYNFIFIFKGDGVRQLASVKECTD